MENDSRAVESGDTTHDSPRTAVPDGGEGTAAAAGDGSASRPVDGERLPRPPYAFTDDAGRDVEIRVFDGRTDALVGMYEHLDPGDRAQGIPPRGRSRIVSWVEMLIDEGLNLVAWHDEDAVGHAALVPMDDSRWELAIFVRSGYQRAHIGTTLLRCLLGHGKDEGVETVWLSVEHHNKPALSLYESLGFERLSGEVEYKMERDL